MSGKHLFEYAVIRIVPRVERQEFLNAGVVLYCKDRKFLDALYLLRTERLAAFGQEVELDDLRAFLAIYDKVCKGGKGAGPIGQLPIQERFRWLTSTRSTIVQTSPVHVGYCEDPQAMLRRLFEELAG